MLTAHRFLQCARCPMAIEPGDGVDVIDGDPCCEGCVYDHQYATSGL